MRKNRVSAKLSNQAAWFFAHVALALGSWLALMLLGYAFNPPGVNQMFILLLSTCVPLLVGFALTRARQDEMAGVVWLVGLIWMLVISLWILDMPTGPNACLKCDATEKLTRTFFSLPSPSGLIDNDGPFLADLAGSGAGGLLDWRAAGDEQEKVSRDLHPSHRLIRLVNSVWRVRMQLLERVNRGAMALHGGNALGRCLGGGDGGDGGNARQNRCAADGLLVKKGILAARGVDDELNTVALDQVDDVGTALLDLEDPLDAEAGLPARWPYLPWRQS